MSSPNIFPSNEKSWTKDLKPTLNYFKENLDSQFFIFTNVHYTGKKKDKRLQREADILLMNKNGLMVIEVKEGLLSDGENNFFQYCNNCAGDLTCRDCKGTAKKFAYPFDQSKDGLDGVRLLIKKELPSSTIDVIQKNHGVIAWNTLRHKDVSPIIKNQHSGFLLTKYQIQEGDKKLKDLLNEKIKLGQWGSEPISDLELNLLINQLKPHAMERDYKVELKNLEKQSDDYDTLILEQHEESFKEGFYGVVKGTSGSGKTMLAIQVAKLHANANRSVIIFFQNLNIASDVRYQLNIEGYGNSIKVLGLYPFLYDYIENNDVKGKHLKVLKQILEAMEKNNIKKHSPQKEWLDQNFGITPNKFFDEICIDALAELGKDKDFENIDTIIVDEAQLFTEKEILSIESLKSDNEPSVFLFGDDFQFLKYGEEVKWKIPETNPKFQTIVRLLQNYRTSSEVTKFMNLVSDSNLRPKEVIGHCEIIKTRQTEWKKNIETSIEYLLKKDFKQNQIAILSPDREFIYSQFKQLDQLSLEGIGLNYIYDDMSKSFINVDGILFSSIRRFTGRQKKAIILLLPDPKNLTNIEVLENYKELAFIGSGRAEHTLFALHSPGVDKHLGFSEVEFL
jgi:thymidine kinase|tara:strand:- start:51 stop:1913 length:1863 start_codon:yes stop_codon:yes gene_type:complete